MEPSQNLGTQALDTLRPLIAAWKGGRAAPASSPNSAAAAAGTTFTARFDTVNVRSGAGSQFPVIGTIHYGDSFTIKSRSNGWYAFDFNGQTGYVSAELVKVS